MSLLSYQGHFKNGKFISSQSENIMIPDEKEVIITFLNEIKETKETKDERIEKNIKSFNKYLEILRSEEEDLAF